LRTALAGALTFAVQGQALALYPDRPVRVIVGFGSGSGSDIQTRYLVAHLEKHLPGQYVVEQRPGASGLLAGDYVAHSPADGYTLLFATTTIMLTLPMMNKKANYSSLDFVPIAGFSKGSFAVYTANKPDKPNTFQELLERLKTGDGTYGTTGFGSFTHLTTLLMLQQAGITNVTHVPYKASGPMLTDLAAGEFLFSVAGYDTAATFLQNKMVRALAVTSSKRLDGIPDVPTTAEVLKTSLDATLWGGLFAPKGTPDEIVHALETAVLKTLEEPEVKNWLRSLEQEPLPIGSKEFEPYIAKQAAVWGSFIKATGLEMND
jgi:tripartite-type tricarboxylate transporter receptor subunit TctC